MQISKYKSLGQGWNQDSLRHHNAKLYGVAGGLYANKINKQKLTQELYDYLKDNQFPISPIDRKNIKEIIEDHTKNKEKGLYMVRGIKRLKQGWIKTNNNEWQYFDKKVHNKITLTKGKDKTYPYNIHFTDTDNNTTKFQFRTFPEARELLNKFIRIRGY